MRKIVFCLLGIAHIGFSSAEENFVPDISLVSGTAFDSLCTSATNENVDPIAVDELRNALPRLEKAWNERGSKLLRETTRLIGGGLRFHDAQATLIFCGFPSMSAPMIVNMRAFIPATAKGSVSSTEVFCNTLYHMLLGRYLEDLSKKRHMESTPLLEKYKDEPQIVRNNLHPYAIEQMVYAKLGLLSDLKAVAIHESLLRSAADLKRARSIVSTEGAEHFVSELGVKQ